MKKLTPAQRDLAEQYLPFTFKRIAEWAEKYSGYGYDAVHDAGITALIKTARNWDESKGSSFFSILDLSITNEMYKIPRYFNAYKRQGVVLSLETPISSYDESLTIKDLLGEPDEYPVFNEDYIKFIKKSLFILTEKEKKCILDNFLEGRRQEDIAADIGVSQMQVSRIIRKALVKIREYLQSEGVQSA